MIPRAIESHALRYAGKYPVITVTGPRQSGKTTLVRSLFPRHTYVSLENPETLRKAREDPKNLLLGSGDGLILDEIQHFPELMSYIQGIVDKENRNGKYILTGSQSLLLSEKISQSLAGRTAILKLLPFSMAELSGRTETESRTFEQTIFTGFYPRVFKEHLTPDEFYPFYFETYVQRDVRQVQNIRDLNLFTAFITLCAGRIGQVLDYTSLSRDTGVSVNSIKGWISVLQASYLIFLLQPYYRNLNTRQIKSPKLYFYDTGLAAWLLNIRSAEQVQSHYLRGGLFENLMILELMKTRLNRVEQPNLFFYRDNNGKEVDCIIEGDPVGCVEFKSSSTFYPEDTRTLDFLRARLESQQHRVKSFLVTGAGESFDFKDTRVLSWKQTGNI